MKVHLIDGTFELFRAHFGAPNAKNSEGLEIGASRGLLRSMAALLRESDVTHLAFAFDTTIESFRNDLFDGYKTGEGMEPELFAQFPIAQRVAKALGIVLWPMVEFEADDALATGALRYAQDERVTQVQVLSPDKDLCQVIGSKVISVDRIRKREYDTAAVVEKFGIDPTSIPDYLALVGDKADGIPGLARWGAKSSATVLAHYKTIENIPDDDSEWPLKVRGAKNLAIVLSENREDAMLYKKLATLRLDVPLAESLDDLRWSGPKQELLDELCKELDMSQPRLPNAG
ncbi:MAG: flap endonuclease [Kofleriaceae bacterium]|nr:flap endonuclease [Kofleriaceae bacterium]